MDLPSSSPAEIARFAAYEYAFNKIEWWSLAFDLLARSRETDPLRNKEYLRFLATYLPADSNNATGFSLADLNDAQRWLLMILVDVFADHMIVTHDTFDDWLEFWSAITGWLLPGFDALLDGYAEIDRIQLGDAWNEFRAALS